MGEQERKILDYVGSQKTPEFQARQREMVAAINAAAQQKPVRFGKHNNGIDKQDVVLYVTAEHQLTYRMEEGFLIVYLVNGRWAYEIHARELEQAYNKIGGK